LLALEAGGADVIEFGVPFTDPVADGATVQHANEVAVAHGTTYRDCLRFVREARAQGLAAPVLLMGYLNPVLAYGLEQALADAAAAGADGFIMVDLPAEEAGEFLELCAKHDLSFVPVGRANDGG
jgi:tryptophan synthase